MLAIFMVVAFFFSAVAQAAPYAAYVMDARTGETLYSNNADTRLYPASLTKMMTLYVTFQAIQNGEISLDSMVTVSKNAAAQPPSRLGLKAGQKIQLRYLIRAAAVKSANDAASAIGDALGGSQKGFARRMNATAKAIGMKNTTFVNANGLTAKGHLSTAHDMSILGRRLFYDFPQYYNIFSRRTTDAGIATVANTNRRFLDSYKGADGIKTGYTEPAGFNLTASAQRGNVRIIATVFGGKSTAHRNAKMAELLDLGFAKAPRNAPVKAPGEIDYNAVMAMANADAGDTPGTNIAADDSGEDTALPQTADGAGKTIRVSGMVQTSQRPKARPDMAAAPTDTEIAALQDSIEGALAEANSTPPEDSALQTAEAETTPRVADTQVAAANPAAQDDGKATSSATDDAVQLALSAEADGATETSGTAAEAAEPVALVSLSGSTKPRHKPEDMYADAEPVMASADTAPEMITRLSTSGGRQWGINIGRFNSRSGAEAQLRKVALAETTTLSNGLRKVVASGGKYDANFVGLTQDEADLACRRLQARAIQCFTMGQ
ncbi:serine hydrolase [Tabrizicola sp. J26]|uniref:D-alanyl-D-alanine carboxypeptidase family protein n=1 Tax=Alitabrizicola rongguiensis TaxID=2909234 RepID=UPI001F3C1C6C|nr:D-alanyl-D-alanine carboxypeptidase family protein [Tabrizicola rongguiensis]MCF1707605.1 serine hydrolase [Tabrizicola rongguiensis]